jgi:hypothetical protein
VDHPTAAASYSNVSAPLFGPNGPSYLDVHQGDIGDCWLLASLAEVADRYPSDIRNMFTYEGTAVENGTTVGLYQVRFFDDNGVARYVTVDTELPAGGGTYEHPNGVLWVALAEKAYAQANGAGYVTTSHPRSDSYGALDLGRPIWALHAITGRSTSVFSVDPTDIAAAWDAGDLIVITSDATPSSPSLVGSHVYAVVGYNPSSSYPFEVYNPWGTDSSGWAPGDYQGNPVYGLFYAGGGFLSQNFAAESFGSGPPALPGGNGDGLAPGIGIVPTGSAPLVSIRPRTPDADRTAAVVGTLSDEVIAILE